MLPNNPLNWPVSVLPFTEPEDKITAKTQNLFEFEKIPLVWNIGLISTNNPHCISPQPTT